MTWRVDFDDRARKELRKLDKAIQSAVLGYLRKNIAVKADPRRFGKPLSYDKHGLWCYRVQDIRVICYFNEDERQVLVTRIGHRKHIYD